MANTDALQDELVKALAVIEPQIRGLHDLAEVSISAPLVEQINEQIVVRERRRDHIQAVLDALKALEEDGYPAMANAVLRPSMFVELQREETDLDAAVAVFEALSPATTLTITLGVPTEKPL